MISVKKHIDEGGYTPEDCRYDREGVWVGPVLFPSEHPRLLFAKTLSCFKNNDRMYGRENNTIIHEGTVYDVKKVRYGFNCVIGGAGFGYESEDGGLVQIPHLGNVVIGDGVIIHNNVCIDRAVIGSTIIGEGTVIDNLVHIAHGVKIGKNCLIVAGTVIGGSCEIGDNCFIGINASIKNKVRIGNGVTIGMGAVVTKDVPDGVTIVGNPGRELTKN